VRYIGLVLAFVAEGLPGFTVYRAFQEPAVLNPLFFRREDLVMVVGDTQERGKVMADEVELHSTYIHRLLPVYDDELP
jgi:hypothetical protein